LPLPPVGAHPINQKNSENGSAAAGLAGAALPAGGAPWAFAFDLWPLAQVQRWQVLLLRGAAGAYLAVATDTLDNMLTERLEALAQAPVATQVVGEADFASLLQTEVESEVTQTAAGTLFGDQYARLVQMGPYRLESYLDGTLFVFTHRDMPGLIGFVGTIFGKHNTNIATMTVGRAGNHPGGEAIGVLNLDSIPPEAALAEVMANPLVTSTCVVKLPAAGELPAWLR
jgi:hypothetical protein